MFIFVFFFLQTANPNTTFIDNEVCGYLAVAVFYYAGLAFAPFPHLCINPAVTVALSLQRLWIGDSEPLKWMWVWLLGDVVGCLLATSFYGYVY